MADINPVPTPDTTTPPPAATPAPAAVPSGLSGLGQAQASPEYAAMQGAAKQYTTDVAAPVVAPPGPHARLFQMIQGLGIGLSAMGTSIGTGGKEGGAAQVVQVQGEQQRQKLEAQQQAQNLKNAKLEQDLKVFTTNQSLIQTSMNLATFNQETAKNAMLLKEEAQNLQKGEQALATGAVEQAAKKFDLFANTGMTPAQIDKLTSGGAVDAPTADIMQNNAQQGYRMASQLLPADNPALARMKNALDSKAPASELVLAGKQLQNELAGQEKINAAKTAKEAAEANSPIGKLSTPEALASPGAQAAIQEKINDPATEASDIPRLRALLPQAFAAQKNAETIKSREAAADQAIKMGDPNQAGALLAHHQTTISELKSRGMTPEYVTKAINAAQAVDPNYNAIADDNYAKIAGSEANNQFFGNAGSLLTSGGTLDQLTEVSKQLSQSEFQTLNKAKNWFDLQTGKAGVSATQAKAVGVADDWAKVMGGAGVASDASRAMVLHIIDPSLSPEQRAAAIQSAKDAVQSQTTSRMGNNPWLHIQYGSLVKPGLKSSEFTRPASVSGNAKLMAVPGHPPVWVEPANQKAAAAAGGVEVQ